MKKIIDALFEAHAFVKSEYQCAESQALDGEFVSKEAREVYFKLSEAIVEYYYQQKFPDIEFILQKLLQDNILLIMSCYHKTDIPEKHRGNFSAYVICNDVFYPATSDLQEISYFEIPDLYYYYIKDRKYGSTVWYIMKGGMRPLEKVEKEINENTIWTVDKILESVN